MEITLTFELSFFNFILLLQLVYFRFGLIQSLQELFELRLILEITLTFEFSFFNFFIFSLLLQLVFLWFGLIHSLQEYFELRLPFIHDSLGCSSNYLLQTHLSVSQILVIQVSDFGAVHSFPSLQSFFFEFFLIFSLVLLYGTKIVTLQHLLFIILSSHEFL